MADKNNEYLEAFFAEALEGFEQLNKLFTDLEKDHGNKKAIDSIFRITHTLKANAAAMGFEGVSVMSHLLEDIFSEIKNGKLTLDTEVFNELYRAADKLGALLQGAREGKQVAYKGLKRKLEVMLRDTKGQDAVEEITGKKVEKRTEPTTAEKQLAQQKANEQAQQQNKHAVAEPKPEPEEPQAEDELLEDEEPKEQKIVFSDLVQVPVRKLDGLVNLVGELLIERDRLMANANGHRNEFARLHRMTSELQYSVMDVRLVQVNMLFHKFHRIVRDVATSEGKSVNLVLEGTENEIDRNVLQIISDSLIHVVRNAVSHGIEKPEVRKKAGKPEAGTVILKAETEKDSVVIRVIDDGAGIDPNVIKKIAVNKKIVTAEFANKMSEDEIIDLIFEPGFSSASTVTDISGRGVGMNVVRKSLDSIGGKININTSLGQGSVFSLTLPSSMAVKATLLFELNQSPFAIPLTFTEAVTTLAKKEIHKVGQGLVANHQEKNMAVLFLKDLLSLNHISEAGNEGALHKSYDALKPDDRINLAIVNYDNKLVGLVVDRLLQQREIVEKPLGELLENARFVTGATILGNGNICLVIDVPDVVGFIFKTLHTILKK